MKILHCADLHLDGSFSGLDPITSERRREEQRELFKSLMCLVRNHRIDLVLIAGDLFDSGFTSVKTVHFVADMLSKLSCPVVISPGNHDPYTKGGLYSCEFSENVHIFDSEEMSSFDFPDLGVTVYGYAFTSARYERDPLENSVKVNPERFNILCAHADTASAISRYAPITPRDFTDSPFGYAALGHIHNAPEIENLGGTVVAYSGCLEGRSFDETDFGGVILLDVTEGEIRCERVRVARHRYMIEQIDVTGAESDGEVADKILRRAAVCSYKEDTALRVILTGSVPPSYTPSPSHVAEKITGLYKIEIIDDTVPLYDADVLMEDMSVRGEYFRTLVRKMKEGTPDERKIAVQALRIGLCALEGKPILF